MPDVPLRPVASTGDRGRPRGQQGLRPWSCRAPPRPRETPPPPALEPDFPFRLQLPGGARLPVPAVGYKARRRAADFSFPEPVAGLGVWLLSFPVHPAFRGAPAQESEKSFCRDLGWRLKGIQRCKEIEKSRMMK